MSVIRAALVAPIGGARAVTAAGVMERERRAAVRQ